MLFYIAPFIILTSPFCDIDLTFLWYWPHLFMILTSPLYDIDLTFLWYWPHLFMILTWPFYDIDLTFLWYWPHLTNKSFNCQISVYLGSLVHIHFCFQIQILLSVYKFFVHLNFLWMLFLFHIAKLTRFLQIILMIHFWIFNADVHECSKRLL